MPLCQHSYGLLPGLIKKSLHDKYNASKGLSFWMAKFARNSKYLCFGTFSGADTQKEHIQSCTGGLSLYSALWMYDTSYGPSVQIGPSQLLTVAHIISPHPSSRDRPWWAPFHWESKDRGLLNLHRSPFHIPPSTLDQTLACQDLPSSNTPSVIQLHLMTQTLKTESNCTMSEWANSESWKSIIMDAIRATTDWLKSTVKVSSNCVKLHFIYRSGFSVLWIQVIVINNNPASCQHSSEARSNPCIATWARLINPRQIKWFYR